MPKYTTSSRFDFVLIIIQIWILWKDKWHLMSWLFFADYTFMDFLSPANFTADYTFIHFADLSPLSPIDSWVPHESNGAMHLPLTYHIIMWRIAWHIADHFTTKKSSNWTKNLANAAKPLVRVHPWPHDVPWPSKIILFVDLKGREQICTFCIFNSVIFMIFCGHIRGN